MCPQSPEKVLAPLELLLWVVGIELGFFSRAASSLNCGALQLLGIFLTGAEGLHLDGRTLESVLGNPTSGAVAG